MKARIIGVITVNEGKESIRSFVRKELDFLDACIQQGYEAASRRPTGHLDTGTLDALFVEERIEDWASLSSRELRLLEQKLRPHNAWAGEVLHKLAVLRQEQERLEREAKALRQARRERQQAKGLTHYPFAAIFGE